MAILVNKYIFDKTYSKVLLPWTVHCLDNDRVTLKSSTAISKHIADHKLKEVHLGMTKDTLNLASDTGMKDEP